MGIFNRPSTEGGFAVVDVETTGLYPSKDRVIEVAVVHLNARGEVTGEFCTLINPQRDVGPTSIHGITAADVLGAPTFAAAARSVWDRLVGMVFVAHNAAFDQRFLSAEFNRCGTDLPPPPVMCTMQLAGHYLHDLPARSLNACCEAARVELSQHHSALDDARAAAQLLSQFLAAHSQLPPSWSEALAAARKAVWRPDPPGQDVAAVTRAQQLLRRERDVAPLASLAHRLPRGRRGDVDAYSGVLDRVLEDRIVTQHELEELWALASELGLTQEAAEDAHGVYVRHLAAAAWRHGTVTNSERADLLGVAALLGVPSDEAIAMLERPVSSIGAGTLDALRSALHVGDRVAITGEMNTGRSEIERLATDVGLRVTSSVSAKTAVVVAGDPYSQSGKAKAARERGVRIVTEQVFLYLLDDVRPAQPHP